jgi:hypothetical protein
VKVRRVPTPFRDRDSNAFNIRIYEAVKALGGMSNNAVESIVAISRNHSFVSFMRYDFPPGGMEDETSWKAASLGPSQREFVQTVVMSAERIRPLVLRGTGTAM